WLGEVYVVPGRVGEAKPLGQQALEVARARKQQGHQAYALQFLGELAMRGEPLDIGQAHTHYQQALALADALGMRPLQAHCHRSLGTLYATAGRREQAHAAVATAIELDRALGVT